MSYTVSSEGQLDNLYVDDAWLVERYAGDKLWSWGDNATGQLGANNITDRSSPVQTIAGGTEWKQVNSGWTFTAAIKTDGSLWLWGAGAVGQLGNNSVAHRSSPVQTIAGGTNWKQVACGLNHTASVKTDGTLWMWGRNLVGQLGDNTVTQKSSPVQTIAGGTDWKQVACGYHTAAIKTDGTLWTWGRNADGQLGTNNVTDRSSPVQTIAGGTDWKSIAAGFYFTLAIKTDGTLWTWGQNNFGQLGDSTTADKSSPGQVGSLTNWKQMSGGFDHTAAIKTDGTLWVWGQNLFGQLGDSTIVSKSSPVQTIAGGTNWKQVACGGYHTGAVKTDGTLWTWGRDNNGQLGDSGGAIVHKSSPIQTIAGGTNWKMVTAGNLHTSSITINNFNYQD